LSRTYLAHHELDSVLIIIIIIIIIITQVLYITDLRGSHILNEKVSERVNEQASE